VLALDRRFHERLWELSYHDLLLGLATQLRARIDAFLHAVLSSMSPDELHRQAHAHVALLDAIASGDRDTAQAAVAEHIASAAEHLRRRDESARTRT
jgi:DNA-binding FadR family transcriptional regulator